MAKPDLFGPALQKMTNNGLCVLGPVPSQAYLKENRLPHSDTAQAISVDFLERLAPSLRQHGVMVLRLGSAGGRTRFALVGPPANLHDFFLHDDEAPETRTPEHFESGTVPDALGAFSYFGTLTETSMVNLAFASGLIGRALKLDLPCPLVAPATGGSTYDFRYRPHTAINQVLEHSKGQVEIDAAFIGNRAGRPHLFVVEAKSGTETSTLAKHKLVYPVLALAPRVPAEIPIVPVYMRVVTGPGRIIYSLTECRLPDPRSDVPVALNQLEPVEYRSMELKLS